MHLHHFAGQQRFIMTYQWMENIGNAVHFPSNCAVYVLFVQIRVLFHIINESGCDVRLCEMPHNIYRNQYKRNRNAYARMV